MKYLEVNVGFHKEIKLKENLMLNQTLLTYLIFDKSQ